MRICPTFNHLMLADTSSDFPSLLIFSANYTSNFMFVASGYGHGLPTFASYPSFPIHSMLPFMFLAYFGLLCTPSFSALPSHILDQHMPHQLCPHGLKSNSLHQSLSAPPVVW